jgi:Tfp pilus assembly protein PilV
MIRLCKSIRGEAPRRQDGWSLLEALAAIVVVGIGITLFTKVQRMTSRDSSTNSRILMAGKMIEKHLEDTRILIAKDTVANWPPKSKTIAAKAPNNITLVSTISPALSPKDGAVVANVVQMSIMTYWVNPYKDTLRVTTYVSKRF